MKNLFVIEFGIFPKNKIIEILKYNGFYFFPNKPKTEEDFGKYLSLNIDKIWFIKKAIILNHIVIGCEFREGTNDSAFKIYFPSQVINPGFNFNPEFSKSLTGMNDFELDSSNPIIAININKKNIDKFINESDITFENVQIRSSKRYKSVNFEVTKGKGIEKLFLFKYKDFYIVIGWLLQGRRNRNMVIYNKNFTDFLMEIESINLKIPESFNYKKNTKKNNNLEKGNNYIHNSDYALKKDSNPDDDNSVNRFKNGPKSKSKLYLDNTPNIKRVNTILEKITNFGLESLSIEELTFLKNNSDGA